MIGISSYKDLAHYSYWDEKFGVREQDWYVIILGYLNPDQESFALRNILDNYSYLNSRTKDVRFFMPGFEVNNTGIMASNATRHYEKFHFYEQGFLETIDWLEESTDYEYSEETELLLLPYHRVPGQHEPICDFNHLLNYNLDTLYKEEKNIIQFIRKAVKVVEKNMPYEETKEFMEGICDGMKERNAHKVFIAGSKSLERERDGIRSIISQVSNRSNTIFQAWTYEDFDRSLTSEGRQADYNVFIKEEADSVIFVLDGQVGGITLEEFQVAIESYELTGHPQIFVYSKVSHDEQPCREICQIRKMLNHDRQYYIEYQNLHDLKQQVKDDYKTISKNKHDKSKDGPSCLMYEFSK